MSDKENTDDLEAQDIETLEARRDELEAHGWDTDQIDDRIDEIEAEDELQERLVDLKIKIAEAESAGLANDPAVDSLREQVSALSERLEDNTDEGRSDIEVMQDRIETFESRDGWEHLAEQEREKLETMGVGETEAERAWSKFEVLKQRASGEDARVLNEIEDKWARVGAYSEIMEADLQQNLRNRIAKVGSKYGLDLSEIADKPVDDISEPEVMSEHYSGDVEAL